MVEGSTVTLGPGGLVSAAPAAARQAAISQALGGTVTSQVTTISGGGGGRMSISPEVVAATAKRRAAEKASMEKSAKEKATREKAETARQERIEAGTISGQLETRESPGFRIGLSERERLLTTGEVIGGRFREVGTGIAAGGIKLVELGSGLIGSLGTKKIQPGQTIGLFGVKDIDPDIEPQKGLLGAGGRFTGILGEIRDAPTGTGKLLGEALVLAPLLGAGVTGFATSVRAVGARAAGIEAITSLSPLRARAGTLGVLESQAGIKDLQFDVAALRGRTGDITGRTFGGRAAGLPDVTISGGQISRRVGESELGVGITEITAPAFRISPAGRIDVGRRAIRTETLFTGRPGKVGEVSQAGIRAGGLGDVFDLRAGASQLFTRPKASLFISEKGVAEAELFAGQQFAPTGFIGGVSRRVGDTGVTLFGAGRGRRIRRITPERIEEKLRVGRFDVRGLELDVSSLGRDIGGIRAPTTGRRPSGQVTTQESLSTQISASVSDISKALPTTTTRALQAGQIPTILGGRAVSRFSGTGQDLVSQQSVRALTPAVSQLGVPSVAVTPRLQTIVGISTALDIAQRPRGRSRLAGAQIFDTSVIQDISQRPALRPETITRTGTIFEALSRPGRPPGRTGIDFVSGAPAIGGFDFPGIITPTFGSGKAGRRPSIRRPGRIAPSLTGIAQFQIGGITGAALPTAETLGVAGITPGTIRLVPGS